MSTCSEEAVLSTVACTNGHNKGQTVCSNELFTPLARPQKMTYVSSKISDKCRPVLQVGACIVSRDQIILGIGYNGFPRGCPDSELPWAKLSRTGDPLDTKYPYVCHAELNAILNKNTASLHGAVSALYKTATSHDVVQSQPPPWCGGVVMLWVEDVAVMLWAS